MFKKLYYYYHHYKMWNYIVGQLKAHPQAELYILKIEYLKKRRNLAKRVKIGACCLCSYDSLIRKPGVHYCHHCPLYKKYNKTCCDKGSLFYTLQPSIRYAIPSIDRITAAKKIRDCVLFWKNRRYKRNNNESK